MNKREILLGLFEHVFEDKILDYEISELSQASFPEWDSLNHLNLIIAIEDAFELDIAPEEMAILDSFEAIIEFLESTK